MEITIKELKELRERLEKEISDNIYDDGSDDNDAEQNAAYTREVKIIDEVGERLAHMVIAFFFRQVRIPIFPAAFPYQF